MSATVLVVDDSATTRSLVASYLAGWGDIEVLEAASGFEALRLLPTRAVDVIVTDINMPDINGLELISFVRANPNYRRIPVVIITTEHSAEDRKRGLVLGASDYLVKPFSAEALRVAVAAALGGRPGEGEA
ncbi:MAG TPA: response regulator [Candidatus Methanoperedens sp.]|nr:response regulator [Candidatus Methanoperedens sp.]